MVEHPPQWFEDSRRSSEQRIADFEQRVWSSTHAWLAFTKDLAGGVSSGYREQR